MINRIKTNILKLNNIGTGSDITSHSTYNLSIQIPLTQNDYMKEVFCLSNIDTDEHFIGNGWILKELSP